MALKMRGKILGMHEAGHNRPYIIVRLKVSRKASRTTIESIDQDELRNDARSQPRHGVTKSFSPLDERNILRLRHARQYPKHTYAQLKENTRVTCSYRTISRILRNHQLALCEVSTPYKERGEEEVRVVQSRLNWTAEEWGLIMWSNECSVPRRTRGWETVRLVLLYAGPKVGTTSVKMIQTYKYGKNRRVMV